MDLDGTADYTRVDIRDATTGSLWSELARHQGPGTDGSYQSANHDISSYISSKTQIRFRTSSTMGRNDIVWFDDIQIQCNP